MYMHEMFSKRNQLCSRMQSWPKKSWIANVKTLIVVIFLEYFTDKVIYKMILHPFKSYLFACKCRIYVKNYVTYNLIKLQKKMFIFGSTCIYFLAHLVLEFVTCYLNLHQIFLEMRNGKKSFSRSLVNIICIFANSQTE